MVKPTQVACRHVFCFECLKTWLEGPEGANTCPTCRLKLFEGDGNDRDVESADDTDSEDDVESEIDDRDYRFAFFAGAKLHTVLLELREAPDFIEQDWSDNLDAVLRPNTCFAFEFENSQHQWAFHHISYEHPPDADDETERLNQMAIDLRFYLRTRDRENRVARRLLQYGGEEDFRHDLSHVTGINNPEQIILSGESTRDLIGLFVQTWGGNTQYWHDRLVETPIRCTFVLVLGTYADLYHLHHISYDTGGNYCRLFKLSHSIDGFFEDNNHGYGDDWVAREGLAQGLQEESEFTYKTESVLESADESFREPLWYVSSGSEDDEEEEEEEEEVES